MNPSVLKIKILIDTGPIVSVINKQDAKHQECVAVLKTLSLPLLTTVPVLHEAVYLLGESGLLVSRLFGMVQRKELIVIPLLHEDLIAIGRIIERYEDQCFGLGDASLMYVAERESIEYVFTLDRKDFSMFRTQAGKFLTLLP